MNIILPKVFFRAARGFVKVSCFIIYHVYHNTQIKLGPFHFIFISFGFKKMFGFSSGFTKYVSFYFCFSYGNCFYLIFILIVNYDSINISLQKVLFKTNFNSYITRSQQDSLWAKFVKSIRILTSSYLRFIWFGHLSTWTLISFHPLTEYFKNGSLTAGLWGAKKALSTIGRTANSVRKGAKAQNMHAGLKSPLKPKWVVLSL